MQRQTYIILYIYIRLLQVTYPGRGEKVADIDRLAIYHTTPAADAIYPLTYRRRHESSDSGPARCTARIKSTFRPWRAVAHKCSYISLLM